MHYLLSSEFITPCKFSFPFKFQVKLNFCLVALFSFLTQLLGKLPESPNFREVGSKFIYGSLEKGDSREEVLGKLRKDGFIQIYEEREEGVVKCAIRWDGFRFELASKLKDGALELCLIEGNKGWQDFHYPEVVSKEWASLRNRLNNSYGPPDQKKDFPEFFDIPLNDLAGIVTDVWNLNDRLVMLAVRRYETKDCCTEQILEFSCCTLLIKPIDKSPVSPEKK